MEINNYEPSKEVVICVDCRRNNQIIGGKVVNYKYILYNLFKYQSALIRIPIFSK